MNDEIRSEKQNYFAQIILRHNRSILRSSIRFGKTKVGLMTVKPGEKVLITYPTLVVRSAWIDDIAKFGVATEDITYSTFKSLHKVVGDFDYIIADEFHKLSPKQTIVLLKLAKKRMLLITGTLGYRKQKLWAARGIPTVVNYDLKDAINDNLVKDYHVYVHHVNLTTELSKYKSLTSMIDWATKKKEDAIDLLIIDEVKKYDLIIKKHVNQRTNLLYNTQVTKDYAKGLIDKLKDEKVLIFALRTAVADELSEKSFHSKSRNQEDLDEFMISEKGHMSTVNVINVGITIKHLNNIVCHTVTANTEDFQQKLGRGLQLGEVDDEICEIHLTCIKDTMSEKWVEEACKSLDQEKISYVFGETILSKLDYIKHENPEKELYLFEGSFCYKSEDEGYYKFLNDKVDRQYYLPVHKLKLV